MRRLIALLLLAPCITLGASIDAREVAVRAVIGAAFHDLAPREQSRWREALLQQYQGRAFSPLWFTGNELTPSAFGMLRELRTAESRGLRSDDYAGEGFPLLDERTKFDAALSVAAARMAMDLHAGRIDPRQLGHDLDVPKARADPGDLMASLARAADPGSALDWLEPRLHQYDLLKTALARYRALARQPQLTRLPALPKRSLSTGDSYDGAPALRALLHGLGDLPDSREPLPGSAAGIFDETLVAGLRTFQLRHALAPDGVLGPATFRELTTPLSHRVSQIVLSLERMRWLPDFASPPIIVNIPQFRLFAFRTTEDLASEILQMDVVVGSAFSPRHTPVFAAEMRYLVLRPYWDVPRSILLEELLPLIRGNANWIEASDYEIVLGDGDNARPQAPTDDNVERLARGALRLRQKPGPGNSLGLVKFMLPNPHNVYLHDTPARALFGQLRRDFSHGCIRVADPMALIRHVLGEDPQWPTERLAAAMESGGPTRIVLPRRIPVLVLYGTALVKSTGETLFFDDVYGHDARLEAALASRRAR